VYSLHYALLFSLFTLYTSLFGFRTRQRYTCATVQGAPLVAGRASGRPPHDLATRQPRALFTLYSSLFTLWVSNETEARTWLGLEGRALVAALVVDLRMISQLVPPLFTLYSYSSLIGGVKRKFLIFGRLSACFPKHTNASRLPHRRLPTLERPGGCCSAAAASCSTAIAARSRAAESGCWLPSSWTNC